MVETQLTLIWTGIVGFAVFMYVLMDGFDLGLGILFPFAGKDSDRDVMMNTVAPVWDFNETWLILGGAVEVGILVNRLDSSRLVACGFQSSA